MLLDPARRLPALVAAVVGGGHTAAAFPDLSVWPLAFLGVALLVLAVRRNSARWAMLMGLAWGLTFFLPHLWWAHVAVGPVPWIALALSQSLFVGAAMAMWVWVRRARWIRRWSLLGAIPFALVWVAAEQVRQVWPFGGFPWGRLAFSQADSPLLALASVAGAPLVSAAVAAIGFLIALVLVHLAQGTGRGPGLAVGSPVQSGSQGWGLQVGAIAGARHRYQRQNLRRVPLGVGAGIALVGGAALIPLPTHAEEGTMNIGAVQGNVATPGLGAFANALEVLDNHVSGTEELVARTEMDLDLVVWPENSSDFNPRVDWSSNHDTARAGVERALEVADVPLLMGTDRYADDARYNEMVLWEPGAGDTFAYAKQIPAAFAEYIPMRNLARMFSPAVDLVSIDMAPGQQQAVVPVPVERLGREVLVGTPICFEVAYDALNRQAVLAGAEVLVVPTNNASFGFTAESTQQLAMSQLRAVEHGRAAIHISTVGVSGVIAPDGQVTQATQLFTPDQFAAGVPLRSTLTIADRLGHWPISITMVSVVGMIGLGVLTGRRSRPGRNSRPGHGDGSAARAGTAGDSGTTGAAGPTGGSGTAGQESDALPANGRVREQTQQTPQAQQTAQAQQTQQTAQTQQAAQAQQTAQTQQTQRTQRTEGAGAR